MAKTQDLKRRIRSVRNTMQLTKAMKTVAAAKLRRAQDRMLAARPYSQRMLRVLRSLASRANPELHPLLQPHGDARIEAIVVTADKGLCGGFNSGIIREAEYFMNDRASKQLTLSAVGKKGRDHFVSRADVARQWIEVFRIVEFSKAQEIAEYVVKQYVDRELDEIYLVFNEFKSAIQCKPIVQRLLPIEPAEFEAGVAAEDYIYEPSAQSIFDTMLPHYVENQIFHAMLESAAAEHAARMTAMDSASSNAAELIDSLTLTMNRVRQASITTEIIEIVSGAEALGA